MTTKRQVDARSIGAPCACPNKCFEKICEAIMASLRGNIRCRVIQCPPVTCANPTLDAGQCCPFEANMTISTEAVHGIVKVDLADRAL
ncbi:hypothetical protein E2C01_008902 [Portunus trituberculatus]|uniref:Uncharacterized protein n=1 Tax=Portunus trituberculatus TaxID=210409 RepID=A0A5B7D3K5_PORTR|nr:hypothetical protein [Portunus trituberculatus]